MNRIKEPEKENKGDARFQEDKARESLLVSEAVSSPEALEELCDLYIPKIYGYVLKRVGKVPEAEDITSTVFEKVLVNLRSFDGNKASFSTWIYRIAMNCITDYYRVRGRKKELSIEDDPSSRALTADSGLERLDTYMVLVEMLRELPSKYQEALTLRYFGGMSVLEVAEVLDISETAASKRILRGLDRLRKKADGGPIQEMI